MNELERYFRDSGENLNRLAQRIGCAPSTLSRPLRGQRDTSVQLARKVEEHTAGAVSAEAFLSICMKAAAHRERSSEAV